MLGKTSQLQFASRYAAVPTGHALISVAPMPAQLKSTTMYPLYVSSVLSTCLVKPNWSLLQFERSCDGAGVRGDGFYETKTSPRTERSPRRRWWRWGESPPAAHAKARSIPSMPAQLKSTIQGRFLNASRPSGFDSPYDECSTNKKAPMRVPFCWKKLIILIQSMLGALWNGKSCESAPSFISHWFLI
jgi:hypothetical protein